MRSYTRNSPQAAARIVALLLISDGNVCRSELETLQQHQIDETLGLAPGGFSQVVHTLCEDLLMSSYGTATMMCSVDEAALASLMAEIDDADLQRRVLGLVTAAAQADQHMAEGEAVVIDAVRRHWKFQDPQAQALLAA